MSKLLILDPATQSASLAPADRDRDGYAGCTFIEVDDAFAWAGKTVDWSTMTIVDAPPPVPESVTPAQIRLAIFSTPGLQSVLDAYVATMDDETRIRWEYSTSVARTDPAVLAAAAWAGISESQLDALFILASSL